MPPWTRRHVLRGLAASGFAACVSSKPPTSGGGSSPSGSTTTGGPGPTSPGTTTTPGKAPNIVYIYADQHRAPMLGCMGHPIVISPNLDALATESVLFSNNFTNSPLCVPARATMMTGWMPHAHGAWTNDMVADRFGPSHVRRIRDEAGYQTAVIGKTHLYKNTGHPKELVNVQQLVDWGFEYAFELLSQPESAHTAGYYRDFLDGLDATGLSGTSGKSRIDRYADYVDDFDYYTMPAIDLVPYELTTDENLDTYVGHQARDWVLQRTDPRPFYLQINFPGPHKPYDSTSEFRDLIDMNDPAFDTAILGPPGEPMSDFVMFVWGQKGLQGMTAEESKYMLMQYYAKVTLIDRVIGQIVEALKATGQYDNTWIVYGADHGDMLGDHEIWGKVVMYEGAIRTPLIIKPPGGTAAWTCNGLVDQRDITASILAMAGLDKVDLPGTSLVPKVLAGAADPAAQTGKDAVFAEVVGDEWDLRFRTAMMRDTRYKLVYDIELDRPTDFYDLEADPTEKVNLVFEPTFAAQISDGIVAIKDLIVTEIPAEGA